MASGGKKKASPVARSNTEIRSIVLQYFYDRNAAATSARGKKGYAVKITDVRRDLKTSHNLSQQEVMSNLNYLLSQGWVEDRSGRVKLDSPLGDTAPVENSKEEYRICREDHGATTRRLSRPG